MTDPTRSVYADDAAAADRLLDTRLAAVRDHEAAGDVTPWEAADMRVGAMQVHLAKIRALRLEHFGTPSVKAS